MKRTLTILSIVAVFLIFAAALMKLLGPKVGNTFSSINNTLPGESDSYGYGSGPSVSGSRSALESKSMPAPAADVANGIQAAPAPAQERLVIENADLAIVVKDPRVSMKNITNLAKELGGFVVSSNIYETSGQAGKQIPEATIVIRVASGKLDEALDRIKAGAVDIQTENRSGQDVTNQYVDLQSQLKAKQAAADKLLEIMDQATRSQDVLNAYAQVQSVQMEIEQLKGQIKYLEEASALSAISIRLIAEAGTQPIAVGPWKPSGAAKDAIQDLIVFVQHFVEFLIYVVLNFLPKLILIAIPLFLLYLAGRPLYRRLVKAQEKALENTKE